MKDIEKKPEQCLLIGLTWGAPLWEIEENLNELSDLVKTAGGEVKDKIIQNRITPDSAYFIGRGKVAELVEIIEIKEISTLVFDDELSPAQVKNLENMLKTKVVDRSAVILDIFADHAKTKEAKTQVELAQLKYYLPRLTRQWTHLSRQVGGIGTRGPGETQLETDRRLIRTRISFLQKELEKISRQKKIQRKRAENLFQIALVGYTNAGKSTLMNALTDAQVLVENQLFATLDTTVKRLDLGSGLILLLSDTVGFIRKLPHQLIASFHTTLAQAIESDLLLHIIDISDRNFRNKIEVVEKILKELEIADKPRLLIMNKVDRLDQISDIQTIRQEYAEALFISAQKRIRIDTLKSKMIEIAKKKFHEIIINIKYTDYNELSKRLSHLALIFNHRYTEDWIKVHLRFEGEVESEIYNTLSRYGIKEINNGDNGFS